MSDNIRRAVNFANYLLLVFLILFVALFMLGLPVFAWRVLHE